DRMVILLFVFFCISPVFVPEEFLFQGIQSVQEDGIGLFLIHALCAADCEITAVVAWKRGVECQQNRLPSGTGDDGIDNITLSKPGVKQEIGRASCRERVYSTAGDERVKEKDMKKITESTIRQAQITAQPSKRTHVR